MPRLPLDDLLKTPAPPPPRERPPKVKKGYTAPAESALAYQAFEDWWNLGIGATLEQLQGIYIKRKKEYDAWLGLPEPKGPCPVKAVPTVSLNTLSNWSVDYHWQDRAIAKTQKEADLAEARAVEELKKSKLARLAEAGALRASGAQVVKEFLTRVSQGALQEGKLSFEELCKLLPKAMKAIELGQKLERTENGEDVNAKFEALIEALIADMNPEEQVEVRAIAFRIAHGQQ